MGLDALIIGPPGSQKTTTLIAKLKKEADPRPHQRVLCIGSTLDVRRESVLSTHNDSLNVSDETSHITFIKTRRLMDLRDEVDKYAVIGIDEGHFFEDLVEFVFWTAIQLDLTVMVAALSGDINMELIGHTHRLIPYVESGGILNLGARCEKCLANGVPARYANASFVMMQGLDDRVGQIKVGGLETYIPVCRGHHPKSNLPIV